MCLSVSAIAVQQHEFLRFQRFCHWLAHLWEHLINDPSEESLTYIRPTPSIPISTPFAQTRHGQICKFYSPFGGVFAVCFIRHRYTVCQVIISSCRPFTSCPFVTYARHDTFRTCGTQISEEEVLAHEAHFQANKVAKTSASTTATVNLYWHVVSQVRASHRCVTSMMMLRYPCAGHHARRGKYPARILNPSF